MFVCVSSVVLEYHSLNPIISLDEAVDSSIKTRTTEEGVTSSKMNLQAAGREPSLIYTVASEIAEEISSAF